MIRPRFTNELHRVCRRAHSESGWSPWHDPASTPPSYVNARSGWYSTMPASIRCSGRPCGQWPRRSAARRKCCDDGPRKVWKQMGRENLRVARCRVRSLMREMGGRRHPRAHLDHDDAVAARGGSAARPGQSPVHRHPAEPSVAGGFQCAAASSVEDERKQFRPLALGLQEQGANHRVRLGPKAPVVSVAEKVPREAFRWEPTKANIREVPFNCRKHSDDVETRR
jgi:hypothetical protein